MSIADKLGFGPKREVSWDKEQSRYIVKVTAPTFINPSGKSVEVILTPPQYEGYRAWQGGGLIQDCLPSISRSEREKLMSGLDDEDFGAACSEE